MSAQAQASVAGRSVGFIGLGKMGGPMAGHLLRAGATLTVFDQAPGAVARLVTQGATAAATPAALAERCEVVFLMLPPVAVEAVVTGPDGLLTGLAAGGIIVDGGNSDPADSRALAARCAERGIALLDVGMSGGPGGAAAGRLAVMVGGADDAFARCRPLFQTFGGVVDHMGPSGSGHLAKLVNNLIVAMNQAVVGEALALAEASGLDLARLTRVISTGAARCWPLEKATQAFNEPPPAGSLPPPPPGGRAPGQLTWGLRLANERGLPLPLTSLVHELYKQLGAGEGPANLTMLRRVGEAGQTYPDRPPTPPASPR